MGGLLLSTSSKPILQLGQYRYYPDCKKLLDTNRQELALRPQSLTVLHLLASRPGRVVSKAQIFAVVWEGLSVTDDSLVQCIADIRRVLNDRKHKILQTLPRRGYRLVDSYPPVVFSLPQVADPEPVTPIVASGVPAQRPAIAVMSFQNIGGDHTGDVVAAGLSADIHFNLAKMSQLFVIAQASANRLQHLLPDEIGQQLGVSYLVQGVTQRLAKQVRATITLVEAASGRVLWSEQYERSLGNFFQLQDEITLDVVTELDHCIEQHEIKRAFSAPPDNLGAWELYHQGLWYCTQTNQAGIEKASGLLKQSLALDPDFAPPYSALSSTCINRIFLGTEREADTHANQALDYAYQCIERDKKNGLGYWALGRALHVKKQHEQALDALDFSIKYKPNFSWSHYTKAVVSVHLLRNDEVMSSVNQALKLSPVDPFKFSFLCIKAFAFIQSKNYREAAICGAQAAGDPRAYHLTHAIAALALKLAGQAEVAKEHIDQAFKLMPGFSLQNYRNSYPHADESAPDRVLMLNTLRELGVPETSDD